MKKILLILVLSLALFAVPGCKKKGPPAAGKAQATDLVRLLPEGPLVVLSFNWAKFAALPLFDKMIAEADKKEDKTGPFADYQDMVNKTGIDLKKDVSLVTVGVYGDLVAAQSEPEIVGVVNLKYDKAKILSLLKENNVTLAEEAYAGLTIYTVPTESDQSGKTKEMRFAFADAGNVVFGTPGKIKAGIDAFLGKAKNAYATGKTGDYLKQIKTESLFWLMVGNIPDSVKKQAGSGGFMQLDMSKAEAMLGYFDFQNKMLSGQLELLNPNEQANKQIADALNGFKGLAAMGAQQEPDLAQLLSGLNLTSSANSVKLTLSIAEDLLNKLAEKAKAKAEAPPAAEQIPADNTFEKVSEDIE